MTIPSWAKVGAKAVFVGAPDTGACPGQMPVIGRVYTISRVQDVAGGAIVALRELPLFDQNGEIGIRLRFFRPLVTRSQEQDIAEHFAHHLRRDVPARERA